MSKGLAIYKHGLRYELEVESGKPQIIGESEKATFPILGLEESIRLEKVDDEIQFTYRDFSGVIRDGLILDGIIFYNILGEDQIIDLLDKKEIYISS